VIPSTSSQRQIKATFKFKCLHNRTEAAIRFAVKIRGIAAWPQQPLIKQSQADYHILSSILKNLQQRSLVKSLRNIAGGLVLAPME